MTIEEIQQVLFHCGWQWQETTFPDGSVTIDLTLDQSNHAFGPGTYQPYGWGPFPRLEAWRRAFDFLILERSGNNASLKELRQYKRARNSNDRHCIT